MTDTTTTENSNNDTQKKRWQGSVVSDKMKDTAVVRVDRFEKHPKYLKYIKRSKKHHAHDPGNTASVGDQVVIEEAKPISKKKRFRLVGVIEK